MLLLVGMTAAAPASGVSDWASSGHAEARLVVGAPAAGGTEVLAGLELRLDSGYITYWRNPGDAGMAPLFDTAGSTNVAGLTVDYPAPRKLDEAGTEAFGYDGGVTFPLHVRLVQPDRPATLVLSVDYAVCATQCLPAKARLTLDLAAAASPDSVALVDAALSRVPRETGLGAPGRPGIDGISVVPPGEAAGLVVRARVDSPSASLFVEPPEGWYLQAGEPGPVADGVARFPVAVLQRPTNGSLAGLDLGLTLVDAARSIVVHARVGASGSPPLPTSPATRVDGTGPKL